MGRFRGKGGFGEVRECIRASDSQKFAVKMIRLNGLSEPKRESVRREARLMRELCHENLVHCIENFEDPNYYYIIMELADEDLSKVILK